MQNNTSSIVQWQHPCSRTRGEASQLSWLWSREVGGPSSGKVVGLCTTLSIQKCWPLQLIIVSFFLNLLCTLCYSIKYRFIFPTIVKAGPYMEGIEPYNPIMWSYNNSVAYSNRALDSVYTYIINKTYSAWKLKKGKSWTHNLRP